MGKTRVCGKRCHHAKHPTCRCWCGGTFHGAAGLDARLEFAGEFIVNKLPTTEAAFARLTHANLFDEKAGIWRERVAAAVAARESTGVAR
jgi:hypothetical protein